MLATCIIKFPPRIKYMYASAIFKLNLFKKKIGDVGFVDSKLIKNEKARDCRNYAFNIT